MYWVYNTAACSVKFMYVFNRTNDRELFLTFYRKLKNISKTVFETWPRPNKNISRPRHTFESEISDELYCFNHHNRVGVGGLV